MDFFSDIDWLALFSCFKLWLQPAKSLQIKKKNPFLEVTLHLLFALSLIALKKKRFVWPSYIVTEASSVECMQPGSLISFCRSLFKLESVYIINQKQKKVVPRFHVISQKQID